ncbi:MAG: DnaD domain protein [Candidatus Coproplasma sp.]
MAFISIAEELHNKSVTLIENKFIKKYLPELDPVAVKVYLYALYLSQSGNSSYTITDFSKMIGIEEEKLKEYFEYLDEFELISVVSHTPFEIKILDCDNYYGKPKKLHPEKYEGLYEEIQAIVTDRMITQDEFRDYLILLEEYGFERNALVMIVNYCVDLKGKDISSAYIKKVAKNFSAENVITAEKVEEKLSAYTLSTSTLLKIFTACSIKRRPEVEDGELLKKWLSLGFDEDGVIHAVKCFKTKNFTKLDAVLDELYKNRKFAPKEIEDYKSAKDSLFSIAVSTAKSLGVYVADPAPYVENYVSVWTNYGFSSDCISKIADYCFLSGRNSFDLMNDFIENLYKEAYVDDESVARLLEELAEDDKFIKKVLEACGVSRKIIAYDRQALARWRDWGFNESMILKSAELSSGKSNPVSAMNYLLSQWKNASIFTVEQIPTNSFNQNKYTYKKTSKVGNSVLSDSLSALRRAALKDAEDKNNG